MSLLFFGSIFSEFSETQKLQLFPSPGKTNACKNTVKVKAAFCSKEFLLRKMRISAEQLLSQPIHGFTNTKVYDVKCSFAATPERNATTTLPRKPGQNFTAFFSGLLRTSASGTLVPSPKIRARAWDWSIKNTGKFSVEKSQHGCLNSWKSHGK